MSRNANRNHNTHIVELVEQEWGPTKLQQTLRWQMHVVPAQCCNPVFAKGNAHTLTGEFINVRLISVFQKVGVEVIGKLVEISGSLTSGRNSYTSWRSFSCASTKKVHQATFATKLKFFLRRHVCGFAQFILYDQDPDWHS